MFFSFIISIFVMSNQLKLKTMKKYRVFSVNLQQSIIVVDEPTWCNVRGIYDKHKQVLILNPNPIENDEEELWNFCQEIGMVGESVIYGDGFHIDTWDKKIEKFTRIEPIKID